MEPLLTNEIGMDVRTQELQPYGATTGPYVCSSSRHEGMTLACTGPQTAAACNGQEVR